MKLSLMDAEEIVYETKSQGGYTFPEPPEAGFMVGGEVKESVLNLSDFTADAVLMFASWHAHKLDETGTYVGSWINSETGKVHLDVAVRVDDKWLAIALAKQRGKLSIWDLKKGSEVKVLPAGIIY